MKMTLRPYQEEAVAAVYEHLRHNDDNPCVVLPTGTGKSLVLGQIATDAVTVWNGRVLILAHVRELLEQNADKIRRICPEIGIGIYSAGLNRRDTDTPVLVAGIQSVYRRACELGPFDLVIVDEAHLVPADGEGMYRTFIEEARVVNPHVRVIGLTATPYRLKGGEICRLRSRGGRARADLSGVHVRGGEFVASEMEAAMDQDNLVRSACQEIVELTRDRNSVLIFATGVAHCQHVAAEIIRISGKECGVITGDTPSGERAETISRFKGEQVPDTLFEPKPPLKFLANVNVLTTGFDATNVDCVVLLRPTMSTGLYVQMVGRGTRLHPGKDDCLVLDYGGNVLRHGPVDAVRVNSQGNGDGEAPAKECPSCGALVHAAYQTCPECGAAFPPPDRQAHEAQADGSAILSGEITDTDYEVHATYYSVHTKRGADDDHPKTMRIEYRTGWQHYVSEWVCPEHTGWARQKFAQWWTERSMMPPPTSAAEAVRLAEDGALATTRRVTVRAVSGEKFDRVTAYELEPIPALREGQPQAGATEGSGNPEYYPEPGWNDCRDEEPQPAPALAWGDDDDIPF